MENGVRWERLAPQHSEDTDLLLVTYPSGAASSVEGKMMRHNGTEYAYLLSGPHAEARLRKLRNEPRDSWTFDSVPPHLYENRGTHPTQGVWFVAGRPRTTAPINEAPNEQPARLGSAVDLLYAMDRLACTAGDI